MINLKLFIISVLLMILASIGLLYSQSGEKEVIQREIDSLLKLSYSNENTDLEKARRYSQLSLSKAESIKDIKRLCDAYISYGYHSYLSKRTDKSLYYLEKAIGLAEKINYQVGLGHAYQRLGKIYSYDGQVEQSYESFNKALRIFEKLNKQIELAQIYNDLGSLFIYGLDDYYLSSKYFQKSKELSKEHKLFEEEIKSDLGNVDLFLKNKKTYRVDGILNDIFQKLKKVKSDLALGKYYKFYTKYYLDSKQYHKSIESAEKAIEHFEKVKNNRQLSVVYTYLDFAYLQIGDKKKALEYSQKALEIRDTLGDLTSKISSLINLAYDHHYLENNKNAIELANNALELLKQQDNKYYTKRAYHLLAEAFKAAGDLEKAYEYKNLELQNSYELDDERKRNSILMLEFSHKMKLKDAELKNLNEKTKNSTYITIFITSLALVVLIFLLIIYSGKRKNTNLLKNKNKIILDQNEELKQEVKNRDKILSIIVVEILNPIIQLRNVSKFIFEKKNYQNAQILEATLSTINNTSEALYQSAQNLIHWSKVKEEKNGFKPEKSDIIPIIDNCLNQYTKTLRIKNIKINFDHEEEVYLNFDKELIGLLLRNLLLNSIKATPEKGIISVNVKEREKFFEFTISDNGDKPSEEEVTKLFNLFDNESQDFYEITQLGLSVCKEIVDKHGGKIWAEANKDKGKNFIFTLMK